MSELKESYVKTGDINTFYCEAGEGHPVIMLHGGGAGADGYGNFKKNISLFAEMGYRAIAFDAVGYGKSDKPDPKEYDYNQEARVNQLLAFIDALNLKDPTLIGNSMGGMTSLGGAFKEPNKIGRLILMGSGGRRRQIQSADEIKKSEARNALFNYEIGKERMHELMKNLTNEDFQVDEEYLDYRLKLTKEPGAIEALKATMKNLSEVGMFFPDEQLQSLPHNTLIIHGKKDRMVPIAHSFEYFELIPNSWLYTMSHCGHWAMLEYPQEFTKTCVNFIENH